MKKKYMIPELHTVEIHCERLIAESLTIQSGDITDESGVCSKRRGSWDEVWDDEE